MSTKVVLKTTIRVNGKDYHTPDEMPLDVRQAYERALASMGSDKLAAVPSASGAAPGRSASVRSAVTITFNGQEYASVDAMPPAIRGMYDRVIGAIDTDGNGIPDMLEAGQGKTAPTRLAGSTATQTVPSAAPAGPVIQAESTSPRLIIAAAVIAALVAFFVLHR